MEEMRIRDVHEYARLLSNKEWGAVRETTKLSQIVERKEARTLLLLGGPPRRQCTQDSGIQSRKVPIISLYYYVHQKPVKYTSTQSRITTDDHKTPSLLIFINPTPPKYYIYPMPVVTSP